MPSALTVGREDPYFEEDAELGNGKGGNKKNKRRKKGIPEGLSHQDAKVLRKFRKRAYRLDLCFNCCCGIPVGWAGLIGLIPGVGDVIAASFALMLVKSARKVDGGVPPEIYSKMIANVAFDFLIGLIPLVGDLINIAYKCNSRNALILEHYLIKKHISHTPEVDLTSPDRFDDPGKPQQTQQNTAGFHQNYETINQGLQYPPPAAHPHSVENQSRLNQNQNFDRFQESQKPIPPPRYH